MRPTVNQLRNFIGNRDAYALQKEDGTWSPVRDDLLDGTLSSHRDGHRTVGTYVLEGNQAKTLVFDFDGDDLKVEKDKAEVVRAELVRLGFPRRSTGIEFSGRKGYHVWLVLADYVTAARLRRVGRVVLGTTGLECEVFPKQDEAKDLGNLIKLPGGVHRVTGKRNDFISAIPSPCSVQVFDGVLSTLPPEPDEPRRGGGGQQVVPCIENIAAGVADGSRNIALYHYAVLLRGSGRVTDEGVDALVRLAASKCDPPYSGWELDQLLESSRAGGPVCDQLPPDLRCADCDCVRNRPTSLTVKAGRLRHAAEGEAVVVEVKSRDGGSVRLDHPDLSGGGKVSVE